MKGSKMMGRVKRTSRQALCFSLRSPDVIRARWKPKLPPPPGSKKALEKTLMLGKLPRKDIEALCKVDPGHAAS